RCFVPNGLQKGKPRKMLSDDRNNEGNPNYRQASFRYGANCMKTEEREWHVATFSSGDRPQARVAAKGTENREGRSMI
ncbi:hypothetical protein K0M31_000488, partial [Melipona bicolor]